MFSFVVVCDLCADCAPAVKIHRHGDLQQQEQGDPDVEFGVLCFVPEAVHPQKGANAAAQCGDAHEGGLRDAPLFFSGFVLVRKHKQVTKHID